MKAKLLFILFRFYKGLSKIDCLKMNKKCLSGLVLTETQTDKKLPLQFHIPVGNFIK